MKVALRFLAAAFLITSCYSFAHAQTNLVPDDVEFQVLKSLFDNTNGASWTTKTNWPTAGNWPATATSAQFGTWYGVTVTNGDVTSISLPSNNLTGPLPASLGNLTSLKWIALYVNKLSGSIPTSIGSLINLEYLSLSSNLLTGSIPDEICNLTKLNSILLHVNQLSGSIPSNIGNLTQLTQLYLYGNQLSGSLPMSIGSLSKVTMLTAYGNKLSGNIPASLGGLAMIQHLDLSNNLFTGTIPAELGNLSTLRVLNLGINQLSGSIPSVICSLPQLTNLDLNSNTLSGSIPVEVGNLVNLVELRLYANQLTGSIPSSIGNLSKLKNLLLYNNLLTGSIPVSIGNLIKLENLYLWNNPLSGSIPSSIGSMVALKEIYIYKTEISGSIPVTIGNLTNLTYLIIHSNRLSGKLPAEIGNLTKLIHIQIQANQLSGPLPPELGALSNLVYFYFYDNQFSGGLPSSFSNMIKLKCFYASRNNLVGSIPSSFSSLNQMTLFYLDGNKFSGLIPDNLFSGWTLLTQMNLSNNSFSGPFPSSIATCTQLSYLVANVNSFTSLPNSVLSLPLLTSFQFENNELTLIPQFQNHPNKANLTLTVGTNRLDFSGMEPLIGAGIKTVTNITQKSIKDVLNVALVPNSDLILTARPKGAATSNVKWEKLNGNTWINISSANADPVTGNTYRIAAATTSAEGKYRWSCTSTTVTGVTLTSDPIEVKVQERFTLDNLAFQYKYDGRKRMTHKKVPGADWVYLVYDDRDRLVFTQDGEQRKSNKWSFTKYDVLNRPIMTGIYTHNSVKTQEEMAALISTTTFFETYTGSAAPAGQHGYTNTVFTAPNFVVANFSPLTVTYYDSYAFRSLWSGDYGYLNEGLSEIVSGTTYSQPTTENLRVAGQITGVKTKVLDAWTTTAGGGTWIKSVNYYDDKYRVIQTLTDNYKGGTDRLTNLLDFTGKVLSSKSTHTTAEPTWKDVLSANIVGNNLTDTSPTPGWGYSGAASIEQLGSGQNGWVEVTVGTGNAWVVGLSDTNPDAQLSSIDYGISYNNGVYTCENATTFSNCVSRGGAVAGDVLRIERVGTAIKYYRNGALLATSATPSTTPLMIDVSMYAPSHSLNNVSASFSQKSQRVVRNFEYDHAGRLTKTWHQIDNNPKVLLAMNEYNELGQLVDKKLYNTDPPTTADASRQFKQSVDYRYNIRGWLSSINNAQLDNSNPQINSDADVNQSDLFGMNLHYNDVVPNLTLSGQEQYNGNISSIEWKNYATTQQKGYGFAYDPMNRLTAANFATASADTWAASNAYHENGFTYDLNGNIMGLTRKGKDGATLDVLTYNYGANGNTGNQLITVTDTGDKNKGFVDGLNVDADYTYDANGNMTIDKNKGISTSTGGVGITYNHLNLPEKVVKSTGEYMKYTYDATGRKLSQQTYNAANTLQKRTDYVGEYVYENDVLQFAQHEEGRVMMTDRKMIYENDGASVDGITATTGSGGSASLVTLNGEDYVMVSYIGSGQRSGAYPIGGVMTVQTGERYLLRAKGYRAGTLDVAFQIRGNGGAVVLANGNSLAPNAASERWTEQVITIPAGITDLRVGLVWAVVATGQKFYLNDFEIIKLNNATPEYQYHLKDHLGNVRTTFTTKDESEAPVATLETNHITEDRANFLKYDDARLVYSTIFDNTNGTSPGYAQRLSGTSTEKMGLARSVAVMPGDKLKMEVYAKYFQASNNDMTAFAAWVASMVSGSTVPSSIVDGAGYTNNTANTTPFGNVLDKTTEGAGVPKAYLNWVIFDENYVPIMGKSGYRRITSTALQTVGTDGAHEKLESPEVEINEAGFAYIWLSNENETPVEVYFDDFKVTHTKSPVVQSDDYYPFGLTFNSYSRENSVANQYQYNGKEKQDELNLGWLDYGARMYQPDLGRFFTHDRFSEKYYDLNPYQYGANNPILYVDINGDSLDFSNLSEAQMKTYQENLNFLMESKMFASYYNTLVSSETVYKISAAKGEDGTPQEAGQFFNPKTNEIGLGENMSTAVMAQEMFHAYQSDGKFYEGDVPTPFSTIETEGDIATYYVMSEAALPTSVYGDWGNSFLTDSFNGPPSAEKVQSAEYQQMFQKAVDDRIDYYKGTGLNAPTYTSPNRGVKPKALEAVVKSLKK